MSDLQGQRLSRSYSYWTSAHFNEIKQEDDLIKTTHPGVRDFMWYFCIFKKEGTAYQKKWISLKEEFETPAGLQIFQQGSILLGEEDLKGHHKLGHLFCL